jgi:adenosylmethionine-8-amino-7-oxononanoate aminotransferase
LIASISSAAARRRSRRHFIARLQSYHGNTLGALAVGGNLWRRQQFEPLLMAGHHIPPCYAYRHREEGESEEAYGIRAAETLRAKLEELGPENVIGFICEPVVGATSGAVPAVPGYLKRIREICDEYGILLILDEIMCGMGRTGTLFACEQDGVAPDIVTIAKGLGAGYQPIGAMLCTREIYETIASHSGFFQHGHTYLERFGDHPHVGDIRGRGLFLGLEFVADRDTKAPFDKGLQLHARIKKHGMANGLMCYPMGGTIDGVNGNHVLLAPPFIIDEGHVEAIVERLGTAVDAALGEITT